MKAKIDYGNFGGRMEISPNSVVVFAEGRDFPIFIEDIRSSNVKRIEISPADLSLSIVQEDEWILRIRRGVYEEDYLIVTRFKHRENLSPIEEYLTKNGKWLPAPASGYPKNIMKIPAPAERKHYLLKD